MLGATVWLASSGKRVPGLHCWTSQTVPPDCKKRSPGERVAPGC